MPDPALPAADLARLREGRHHDPHQWLGLRSHKKGMILRAWKPGAESVSARFGKEELPLEKVDEAGLFEAATSQAAGSPYTLLTRYPGGNEHESRDPYAFPPSLGETDLHLFSEGTHRRLWEKMGARFTTIDGVDGAAFAVWAPNAAGVSLVGDFNYWNGLQLPMRSLGSSGVWELFVPGLDSDCVYKYELRAASGLPWLKSDPYAQASELPPATGSRLVHRRFEFSDQAWMEKRGQAHAKPASIYEVHLGSWRTLPEHGGRSFSYREIAAPLADYVADMGFTHVEFMPLMEHPYGPSWGYQVSSYYSPTARFGDPDDLRYLVDHLHSRGIGVILDWVPAHFPKDDHALGRFDGTALYEHGDPREGEHPDWGTYIFNYGRNEVRGFLMANALYWLSEFHVDGLRIDAVASMLYRDYSRNDGEWIPNRHGGRENEEAISLLKEINRACYAEHPGVMMIAEESTAWAGVSRPLESGGLGFGFKWNMGWMHDTLDYFGREAVYRRFHHNELTFSFIYAWTENFILPLSHDEVVHGKGSLLARMPGDAWQQFANLRCLYAYMWAHPGKKLLFMGSEFAQGAEWKHDQSLDWHLLDVHFHEGVRRLVADLNHALQDEAALYQADCEADGFQWVDGSNDQENILIFRRKAAGRELVCIANFSPVPRESYQVGLPSGGHWAEVVNTDSQAYGGSNQGNAGGVDAEKPGWHGLEYSATIVLPPLSVLWLKPQSQAK